MLIWLVFAPARTALGGADEERAFYREQFAGWGGIVFRCVLDKSNKMENRLCEAASEDARFLAAAAKMPFKSVGAADYYHVARAQNELSHALVLTAYIHSLPEPLCAHILLEASSFYSAAVDRSAADDSPAAKPRAGTLKLWSGSVIGGGGSGSELEAGLGRAMETRLKQFMSLYAESRH